MSAYTVGSVSALLGNVENITVRKIKKKPKFVSETEDEQVSTQTKSEFKKSRRTENLDADIIIPRKKKKKDTPTLQVKEDSINIEGDIKMKSKKSKSKNISTDLDCSDHNLLSNQENVSQKNQKKKKDKKSKNQLVPNELYDSNHVNPSMEETRKQKIIKGKRIDPNLIDQLERFEDEQRDKNYKYKNIIVTPKCEIKIKETFPEVTASKKIKPKNEQPPKQMSKKKKKIAKDEQSQVVKGKKNKTDKKEEENSNLPEVVKPKEFTSNNDEFTIFVGNLPVKFNKKKVIKHFSAYGKIQNARIRCTPAEAKKAPIKIAARKQQYRDTASNVCAYVRFESKDSAVNALTANGTLIEGHHIRVDTTLKQGRKKPDKKKAIYICNLAYDLEEDALWDFFDNCGKIESVRMIKSKSKGYAGIGVAYVNFLHYESVDLALQLNGQLLQNRPINIQQCRPPLKSQGDRRGRHEFKQRHYRTWNKVDEETGPTHPWKREQSENSDRLPRQQFTFAGRQAEKQKVKRKTKPNKELMKKKRLARTLRAGWSQKVKK